VGTEVTLVGRNDIGNWWLVYVDDTTEGWAMAGYFADNLELHLTDIPVIDSYHADLARVTGELTSQLHAIPILPTISPAMHDIFALGQSLGNMPNVISKVGDSNSAQGIYLSPISAGNYDLGAYDFLQDTVDYFYDSFGIIPQSAKVGMNMFSLFEPIWADPDMCEVGESPLLCEYRINKPSVAVVMFGANDVKVLNRAEYETQMRLLIEQSLENGVIPLLLTFGSDPDLNPNHAQLLRFNLITVQLADEYEVPLLNLWASLTDLPRNGVGEDLLHLTSTGDGMSLTGNESFYGLSLHHMLVLRALDIIRREVILTDEVID
ncbi:MAG TPA: SGNH/GDSL hydrolase family protein, partial [Aggregatilineales bacterium]|nr:SGNH/GDSL hydrolase family protein [Aggregatilineales bacterium]